MNEIAVTNMPPVWTFYVIAISQLLFGVATLAIAAVLVKLIGNLWKSSKMSPK
jgi:hypothetical protein